jgi:hypothetical protein
VIGEPSIPEEFMFSTEQVALEEDLTKFAGRQKGGKGKNGQVSIMIIKSTHDVVMMNRLGGRSGVMKSRDRGRFIRAVLPKEGEYAS